MNTKSLYWFVMGLLYILIWDTVFVNSIDSKEIEAEKQIYRDVLQNIQETIVDGNKEQDTDNIGATPIHDNTLKESILNRVAGGEKYSDIVKDIFNDLPPINVSFNVTNSSMTMPMNVTTDKFNISDVNIMSPHIEFPLDFQADNMTFNISVAADTFPISMNLISNKSDVPISLGIYGANNIPVNLNITSLTAPLLNYFFFAVFGGINAILLIWVIIQQVSIHKLTKRLDNIDVCNQVLNGKRYKQGNTWYQSINGDGGNQVIDINSPNSRTNCSNCDQQTNNSQHKFCFNCGNSLL